MKQNGFQRKFRTWLGDDPETAAKVAAEMAGYSLEYVRWAAGLRGNVPWPGSRRFERRMRALGCGKRWRDRTQEQLAWAFRNREEMA